jgi:hypothetical protein
MSVSIGAAHRSYRHLERLAQFGLGGNGLARLPLLGTDLGRELIAQLQVNGRRASARFWSSMEGMALQTGKWPSLPVAGELHNDGVNSAGLQRAAQCAFLVRHLRPVDDAPNPCHAGRTFAPGDAAWFAVKTSSR